MFVRRKTFVLIMTYLLAAVIALGAYTAVHAPIERSAMRTARYGYRHALEEVITASTALTDQLHRASYATGSALSNTLCADISGSCAACQMTMAVLPFSTQELRNTASFMGTTGEYALSLLQSSGGFDDAQRAKFASLYKTSRALTAALREMQDGINDGAIAMDEPENLNFSADRTLSREMLSIESGMPDTLSGYKAPADVITEAEARAVAAKFIGADESALKLKYRGENGVTGFSFPSGSISVDGAGSIVSLLNGRAVSGDMKSAEMEGIAKTFLAERGYENLRLKSSERIGSVQTMVFDCFDDGVTCNGDSIRISVAGDDGSIYAFDAAGHLENHSKRPDGDPAVSEDAARAALPGNLQAKSCTMCGFCGELCYAFDCASPGGDSVTVIVSALDGCQRDILI